MLVECVPDTDLLLSAGKFLAEGRWRKAERICEELLSHGENAQAAFLLGRVYEASGQPKRALECFARTLVSDPGHSQAHYQSAEIHLAAHDPQASAQAWIAGLEIDPSYFRGHVGLADALIELTLYDAAMIAAKQAMLVEAENPDAWDRLAKAAELAGNRMEAIQALEKCNQLRPASAATLHRLALLHIADGNLEQGRAMLHRAVDLQPRNPALHFDFAQALAKQKETAWALHELREAIRLKPHFPEALTNMGILLRANRQYQEAENAYKKACAQNSNFALAWNNLANLYIELVRLDDAERCYAKAIAAFPDYPEAHTGRAMLRLLKGNFAEGWNEYEWRWSQPGVQSREFAQPAWDGSPLADKTILLHAEQGAGDTVQFIRYATLLKQMGARVLLYCQASLRTLMETATDVDQVFCGKDAIPAFDVHAPLMSLPRLCGTDLTNLPSDTPYLSVPADVPVPEALLSASGLKVGLVWAGNPNHHNDRNRSIPAVALQPLLEVEGTRFFSLQVGGEELPHSESGTPVIDLAPVLSNYAVTAACLQHLDLLITVDTSVAHVAGALGRPVWMMLPACNDWRWLLGRSDSPWYPTMRIFRQSKPGDWSDVLKQIEVECGKRVMENR